MGSTEQTREEVTSHVVYCYTVEFLAAGCCGYPKFRWFRVLLDKFTGSLIKGHRYRLRNFSVTNHWGLGEYPGEEYHSACPTVIHFYRCLLSDWRRDVCLDEPKGLTEYLCSYALMLCS